MRLLRSISCSLCIILTFCCLQSCRRADPEPLGCEAYNQAQLVIINQTTNHYEVSYNVTQKLPLNPSSVTQVTVEAGSGVIRALQNSFVAGLGSADLVLPYSAPACGSDTVVIQNECITMGFGTVYVYNRTPHIYNISLNGARPFYLDPRQYLILNWRVGGVLIEAKQDRGFIGLPKVVRRNIPVVMCGTDSLVIE